MRRRSLLLTAPGRLQWVEEQLPSPGSGEVLVRTIAGAISIGTELPQYRGTERAGYQPSYPAMTGYESLGQVVSCSRDVSGLTPGDRVLSFYGHRTAAIVPAAKAITVPPDIPDGTALLAILSCDVMKGVRKLAPDVDERVLVTGAGTIGLLTVWTLTTLGIRAVEVIEPDPYRRDVARELGARGAWSPDSFPMAAGHYQAGFECSSRDAAFRLLQQRMQPNGRICVLADGNLEPLTLDPAFHQRELTIVGSSDGWDYRQHASWFFGTVRTRPHRLSRIFDVSIQDDALADTFERLADGSCSAIKVFVRYRDR